MIPRRTFVVAAIAGALTASRTEAQPAATTARLGMLMVTSLSNPPPMPELDGFMTGLRQLGWSEGQNLTVERRPAGNLDDLPGLAAELVKLNVTVLFTAGPEATRAARGATATIPIVMIASTEPRQLGAAGLARPGGNLTGLTVGQSELVGKRLELLKTAIPRLARVAVLWDVPRPPDDDEILKKMTAVAGTLGLRLHYLQLQGARDFDRAFTAAKQERAGALLLIEGPRAVANRAQVADLALRHRLPMMGAFRQVVEAGGLMSYGPDLRDLFRRAAHYVDKILRGARPSELPIEQPTKFAFAINARTAKALGLTIPPALLQRADEVIE